MAQASRLDQLRGVAEQLRDALAAGLQLGLELLDLGAATGDELELTIEVPRGLLEDRGAPAGAGMPVVPLVAQRRARVLRLDDLAQLLERQAEQLLEPQRVAQPLHVLLGVGAVLAGLALARRAEEADLLVVADRARCRADRPGDLADAHQAATASGSGSASASGRTCAGRMRQTKAPNTDVAASTHRAVCMFWMNGSSCAAPRPLATPEKIFSRTSCGTAFVTTAMTNAIDSTAPVFCSSVRTPAATPRRWGGTAPII